MVREGMIESSESQLVMPVVNTTKTMFPQTIQFSGQDEENSAEVVSEDVTLVPSSGEHKSGSSRVKLKNIVDFSWEVRFYTGQLLAVHMGGKYVAYGIKSVGKGSGVVRVVNRDNNQRSLLKDMQGMVQDIAFAHVPTEVLLACVDEPGNLLVYAVQDSTGQMLCPLVLHVQPPQAAPSPSPCPVPNHRVIWCPFIPDEDDTSSSAESGASYDDVSRLLVLTRGCKAELWHVGVVAARYGAGPLRSGAVAEGFLPVHEHSKPIVDAAFSPDGVALATASLDGDVKFFQVYLHTGERPRCLHHWQPHEGRPVSALFFLDNHRCYNPDVQFWKFAITGAENNTELKLWSCESWTCLQTLRFCPESPKQAMVLKAGLDLGAGYLLLSDIFNKLLYVLQIHKNSSETSAYIRSVTEFTLPYPILSFGIVDAGLRAVGGNGFDELCSGAPEDGEEVGDFQQGPSTQVMVRMYLVQPKSLQECHITFQPPSGPPMDLPSLDTLSDSLMFKEGLSDLSRSLLDKSVPDGELEELPAPSAPLSLMTPDAFSSPAKKESPGDGRSPRGLHHAEASPLAGQVLDGTLSASPTMRPASASAVPQNAGCLSQDDGPLATSEPLEGPGLGAASGGSSPSREVQQILSLQPTSSSATSFLPPFAQLPAAPGSDPSSGAPDKVAGTCWPEIPLALVSDARKAAVSTAGPGPMTSDSREAGGGAGAAPADEEEEEDEVEVVEEEDEGPGPGPALMQQVQVQLQLQEALEPVAQQLQALARTQQQQQALLQEVHAELQGLQAEVRARPGAEARLEESLAACLDSQLQAQRQAQEQWERDRQEAVLSALSQVLSNSLSRQLHDLGTNEFKSSLLPAVLHSLEPMKRQMQAELSQKLTATDHLLKENIAKLVQSKSVVEVLASSAVAALQPALQSCFKEVFVSTLMPALEKACQSMFQQVNEAFSRGTKDYLQALEAPAERQRRQQERLRELQGQLQAQAEAVRSSADALPAQMQAAVASVQEGLEQAVREAVKEQVAKGFHAHRSVIEDSVMNAVRSRAVTPAPHLLDTQLQQSQVLQLIAQGQVNAAFQQALSASDLSLVVFVCEKVNPAQVFNQSPCPLQQPVLLSLIQQLSADMGNHTELRHKYLEEAVMNLDPSNPMTREHLPAVVTTLQRQLATYMQANPNNKITRSMRMLHMATQSLITS